MSKPESRTILVNGRPKQTNKKVVSYADIIGFAGWRPGARPTVTWSWKGKPNSGGSLLPGDEVKLAGNETFDVSDTANA